MQTVQKQSYYQVSDYRFCLTNSQGNSERDGYKFEEDDDATAVEKFKNWKKELEKTFALSGCRWIKEPELSKVEHITTVTRLA